MVSMSNVGENQFIRCFINFVLFLQFSEDSLCEFRIEEHNIYVEFFINFVIHVGCYCCDCYSSFIFFLQNFLHKIFLDFFEKLSLNNEEIFIGLLLFENLHSSHLFHSLKNSFFKGGSRNSTIFEAFLTLFISPDHFRVENIGLDIGIVLEDVVAVVEYDSSENGFFLIWVEIALLHLWFKFALFWKTWFFDFFYFFLLVFLCQNSVSQFLLDWYFSNSMCNNFDKCVGVIGTSQYLPVPIPKYFDAITRFWQLKILM